MANEAVNCTIDNVGMNTKLFRRKGRNYDIVEPSEISREMGMFTDENMTESMF